MLVLPRVFNCQVLGLKAIHINRDSAGFAGSTGVDGSVIPAQHYVLRLLSRPHENDIGYSDVDLFPIRTWGNANHLTCRRRMIDGLLNGMEVSATLMRNRDCGDGLRI